ncbi:MAG: DUF3142 domain-containing protein [Acidobacteria bacterium]|nr:DUF3142 domain-containing protein [Acidobacteriota bacterium]
MRRKGGKRAFGLILALATMSLSDAASLPRQMLWAWERQEDLRFLDPREAGVAYLAETLRLHGDVVDAVPRLQPLRLAAGTQVVAVIRIETSSPKPSDSDTMVGKCVDAIVPITGLAGVIGVQIDFDATHSEREFYASLLRALRARLPDGVGLDITALASWCLGDPWLGDLPIDDAIPMLFRMGADGERILSRLSAGGDFSQPICRSSVGLSTDEPLPHFPTGRRRYIFNPSSWRAEAWERVRGK